MLLFTFLFCIGNIFTVYKTCNVYIVKFLSLSASTLSLEATNTTYTLVHLSINTQMSVVSLFITYDIVLYACCYALLFFLTVFLRVLYWYEKNMLMVFLLYSSIYCVDVSSLVYLSIFF